MNKIGKKHLALAMFAVLFMGALPIQLASASPIVILIDPVSGPVGTVVAISGESEPGSTVSIYWDIIKDWDGTAGFLGDTIADGVTGYYELYVVVPEAVAGEHGIIALEEISGDAASQPFTVVPEITVDPDIGIPGDLIDIEGTGFGGSVGFTVFLDENGDGKFTTLPPKKDPVLLEGVTTALGSFDGTFTVPDVDFGVYTIYAFDDDGNRAEGVVFTIARPYIILDPDEGFVYTEVTVTGGGFAADSDVDITWDGDWVASTYTDAFGGFVATFDVPASVTGSHTVTATDEEGLHASATFTVVPHILLWSEEDELEDPTWGFWDSWVSVHGSGFAGDVEGVITWEGFEFWQVTFDTDAFGSFIAGFEVPDGSPAGTWTVTAIDKEGNTDSDEFTLYYVYEGSDVGIWTPRIWAEWYYEEDEFVTWNWEFYHHSYDDWYYVLSSGIQIFRITYEGVTYLHDLYQDYQSDLYEEVVGFEVVDVDHIQGVIELYTEEDGTLLVTIVVDIYTPLTAEDYYAIVFNITAEAELDDLAFYNAYDLDVYESDPNWAYYDSDLDAVYQGYFPTIYEYEISQDEIGYAGFASVMPSSTHHDVWYYGNVMDLNSYFDYDYNYRDRDEYLHYDAGVGLQWTVGPMSDGQESTIPLVFATSESLDDFKTSIMEGKTFTYGLLTEPPTITLTPTEDVGLSIVTVTGKGFMPYSQVDIHFGDILAASFNANASGAFTDSFVVPVIKAGEYAITATDEYGLQAQASFTITVDLENLVDKINELTSDGKYTLEDIVDLINKLTSEGEYTLADIITALRGTGEWDLTTIAGLINTLTSEGEYTLADIIEELMGTGEWTLTDIAGLIAGVASDLSLEHDELSDLVVKVFEDLGIKLDDIDTKIIGIEENIDGLYLVIDDLKVKLDDINATIVGIEGKIATIETDIGTIQTDISNLGTVSIEEIKGDIATIKTDIGTIREDISDINGEIVAINGEIVTISTDIGDAETSLSDINAKIKVNKDNIATIQTDIGTIKGKLTSIDDDIATIETDIGTIKTSTESIETTSESIKTDTSLQPATVALSLIAAIGAIAAAAMVLRKVYVK